MADVTLGGIDFTGATKLFAALFAIMNPLTIIPVFLSLTADCTPAERRSVLLGLDATVAVGFLVCAVGGHWVLDLFGIGVNEFELAGGLIVLLIALSMLSGNEHSAHAGTSEEKRSYASASSLGVYPLGVPLAIGPGTMTAHIVFSQTMRGPGATATFYATLLAYVVFFAACMIVAPALANRLPPSALSISKRLMGIVLAAIATEMMVTALRHLFPALG